MLEKGDAGLASADLMRQHQPIEMPQHVGELLLEKARVDQVRVAAEQNAVARLEPRNQLANLRVRPEDVGADRREKFVGTTQAAFRLEAAQELGLADPA